jgi:hypothetical protein
MMVRQGLQDTWRWMCAALVVCALFVGAQAQAQLASYRLEIRGYETSAETEDTTLFFTVLNSSQDSIQKVDLKTFNLLSEENQQVIPWGEPTTTLLKDTKGKNVAILFVIANYRAFNESNSRSRAAVQEFLEKMRPTDVAGIVIYADTQRKLPFTQDAKSLATQLASVNDETEQATPRIFAALSEATRRFNSELDQLSVQQRYLVLVSDGAGVWAGNKDETALDNKINRFAARCKELNVIPLVVGHAPLLGEDEPGLVMLRQLAARTNGTLRMVSPKDRDGVFGAMDATYNEIYGSHVMTFQSPALTRGQNHKVRLAGTVDAQKLKSQPIEIYVPDKQGINTTWLLIGGGVCLALGMLGALVLGVIVIIKKRKSSAAEPEYEPDYYENYGDGVVPVAPSPGAAAPTPKEEYNDEPPASYFAKLTVRSGPVHGRRFYITEETTTIGKDANNAIILKDGTVSKRHAGIRIKDGKRYEVHDFGSSNGTFVNERRVAKQFLKDGDVIKLGETEMIFSLE